MSRPVSPPMRLDIPDDGRLTLTPEQLQQMGFAPGDHLVVTSLMPGQLYIHKAETFPPPENWRETLSQMIQDAFHRHGYQSRAQVIALIREVRQEMADDD